MESPISLWWITAAVVYHKAAGAGIPQLRGILALAVLHSCQDGESCSWWASPLLQLQGVARSGSWQYPTAAGTENPTGDSTLGPRSVPWKLWPRVLQVMWLWILQMPSKETRTENPALGPGSAPQLWDYGSQQLWSTAMAASPISYWDSQLWVAFFLPVVILGSWCTSNNAW